MAAEMRRLAAEGKHPAFKGSTSAQAGRLEARKRFSLRGKTCEACGEKAQVRHHRNGDTHNNEPGNVVPMCRSCHAKLHAEEITAARLASEKWWASVRRYQG